MKSSLWRWKSAVHQCSPDGELNVVALIITGWLNGGQAPRHVSRSGLCRSAQEGVRAPESRAAFDLAPLRSP